MRNSGSRKTSDGRADCDGVYFPSGSECICGCQRVEAGADEREYRSASDSVDERRGGVAGSAQGEAIKRKVVMVRE